MKVESRVFAKLEGMESRTIQNIEAFAGKHGGSKAESPQNVLKSNKRAHKTIYVQENGRPKRNDKWTP